MAERATIARPYSKAAFEFARESGELAQWSKGLAKAASIVVDAQVVPLIHDPHLTASELARIVTDVAAESLSAAMQNFIKVLAGNHRLALLPQIAAQFEQLRAAAENTVDVEITSAVALNAQQSEKLKAALAVRLKSEIRMHHAVDPALLGGAVVRAGDMVIDGSLKGRLERLATNLAE